MAKPDEKICFIISPIDQDGTPKNIKWKQVRKHIIDPVAEEKGYKTIRADDISKPGKITSQIIDYLRDSHLVIADLSDSNPNVFYELGIRDAVRKPVILIRDSHFEIPFDVRDLRLLKYSLDLDDIEESKKELAKYIDSIEDSSFRVSSPVVEALLTPADEIIASTQDYFNIIAKKLDSISAITARSKPTPPFQRARMSSHLQELGIVVIERAPTEVPEVAGIMGISTNYSSFIDLVKINLLSGINFVNHDPFYERYWLWRYGYEAVWYFYDESLDHLKVGQKFP